MILHRTVLIVAVLLLCASALSAEPRNFEFGAWGRVVLDIPEGWTATTEGPDPHGLTTVAVAPTSGPPVLLQMSPVPLPESSRSAEEAARTTAGRMAKQVRKAAVEKDLPIRTLEGPECRAFHYSATDKTVAVGSAENFKYMDQGALAIGPRMMTFTILANTVEGAERTIARDIVRSARHLAGASSRPATGSGAAAAAYGPTSLAYPGKSWRLILDLQEYAVDPPAPLANGQGTTLRGKNPKTGMLITVFLEPAKPGWTAVQYRDDYWNRVQSGMPMERKDILLHEKGEAALLEFRIPKLEKMEFNHKSLNAFWVHDGVWVDLHLSKASFAPEDQALFDQVVASARFEP